MLFSVKGNMRSQHFIQHFIQNNFTTEIIQNNLSEVSKSEGEKKLSWSWAWKCLGYCFYDNEQHFKNSGGVNSKCDLQKASKSEMKQGHSGEMVA